MSRPPLQRGCLLGPQDVQECVCGIVQNRANLAATLKDARTVVGKLERFMGVVVQALFLFLYLMIWQVRSWDLAVLAASADPARIPHDVAVQFCGTLPG